MGGTMPSSNKVLVSSVAKATTRELPNKAADILNMSQRTSALPKDKGPTPTTDPGKAGVAKWQHSDTPSSPGYPNVYVRRKVESEHNKVNSSQELKANGKDKIKEQEAHLQDVQHDEVNKPQHDEVSKFQHDEAIKPQHVEVSKPQHEEVNRPGHEEVNRPGHEEVNKPEHEVNKPEHEEVNKPEHEEVNEPQVASPIAKSVDVELVPSSSAKLDVETVPEKTDPQTACGTGIKDDAEQSRIQYWSERFNRLQTYLENCDQSTQEGYLRSKNLVET
jgi:hypothetical protein